MPKEKDRRSGLSLFNNFYFDFVGFYAVELDADCRRSDLETLDDNGV